MTAALDDLSSSSSDEDGDTETPRSEKLFAGAKEPGEAAKQREGTVLRYAWFDFFFRPTLLDEVISELHSNRSSGKFSQISPEQLIFMFLYQVTKRRSTWQLKMRRFSIERVERFLDSAHAQQGPGMSAPKKIRHMVTYAARVALAFEYTLEKILAMEDTQQVLLLAGMRWVADEQQRGRVDAVVHCWVLRRALQPPTVAQEIAEPPSEAVVMLKEPKAKSKPRRPRQAFPSLGSAYMPTDTPSTASELAAAEHISACISDPSTMNPAFTFTPATAPAACHAANQAARLFLARGRPARALEVAGHLLRRLGAACKSLPAECPWPRVRELVQDTYGLASAIVVCIVSAAERDASAGLQHRHAPSSLEAPEASWPDLSTAGPPEHEQLVTDVTQFTDLCEVPAAVVVATQFAHWPRRLALSTLRIVAATGTGREWLLFGLLSAQLVGSVADGDVSLLADAQGLEPWADHTCAARGAAGAAVGASLCKLQLALHRGSAAPLAPVLDRCISTRCGISRPSDSTSASHNAIAGLLDKAASPPVDTGPGLWHRARMLASVFQDALAMRLDAATASLVGLLVPLCACAAVRGTAPAGQWSTVAEVVTNLRACCMHDPALQKLVSLVPVDTAAPEQMSPSLPAPAAAQPSASGGAEPGAGSASTRHGSTSTPRAFHPGAPPGPGAGLLERLSELAVLDTSAPSQAYPTPTPPRTDAVAPSHTVTQSTSRLVLQTCVTLQRAAPEQAPWAGSWLRSPAMAASLNASAGVGATDRSDSGGGERGAMRRKRSAVPDAVVSDVACLSDLRELPNFAKTAPKPEQAQQAPSIRVKHHAVASLLAQRDADAVLRTVDAWDDAAAAVPLFEAHEGEEVHRCHAAARCCALLLRAVQTAVEQHAGDSQAATAAPEGSDPKRRRTAPGTPRDLAAGAPIPVTVQRCLEDYVTALQAALAHDSPRRVSSGSAGQLPAAADASAAGGSALPKRAELKALHGSQAVVQEMSELMRAAADRERCRVYGVPSSDGRVNSGGSTPQVQVSLTSWKAVQLLAALNDPLWRWLGSRQGGAGAGGGGAHRVDSTRALYASDPWTRSMLPAISAALKSQASGAAGVVPKAAGDLGSCGQAGSIQYQFAVAHLSLLEGALSTVTRFPELLTGEGGGDVDVADIPRPAKGPQAGGAPLGTPAGSPASVRCLCSAAELQWLLMRPACARRALVAALVRLSVCCSERGSISADALHSTMFPQRSLFLLCDCLCDAGMHIAAAALLQTCDPPHLESAVALIDGATGDGAAAAARVHPSDLPFAACIWHLTLLERVLYLLQSRVGVESQHVQVLLDALTSASARQVAGLTTEYSLEQQSRHKLIRLLAFACIAR